MYDQDIAQDKGWASFFMPMLRDPTSTPVTAAIIMLKSAQVAVSLKGRVQVRWSSRAQALHELETHPFDDAAILAMLVGAGSNGQ